MANHNTARNPQSPKTKNRRQTKMKNNQKSEKTIVQIEKEIDPYEALKGKRNSPETTYKKVEHLADKIILNLKEK